MKLENYILPKVGEFRKKYPKTEVKFVKFNEQSYDQYFTEEVMQQLDAAAKQQFSYGTN